jgi:iron(III) transport system substrate-binding protein
MTQIFYPEKMLDPLKPVLILPEVLDPAKWKMGKPLFSDPEQKYVLRVFRHITAWLYVNTDHVKPEELHSASDLLNPKWRGKIATDDPTVRSGAGTSVADYFYLLFGPEFVKKLYFDQKPIRSRDRRQLTDWLARGTYPICFACDKGMVEGFQKEGFKIAAIFELSDVPGRLAASSWVLGLANKAPHPNSARIFSNWLVSKEALEIYSRGEPYATLRSDVDESFLDPRTIPRPGVRYIWDDGDWDFNVRRRPEIRDKVLKLFKSS